MVNIEEENVQIFSTSFKSGKKPELHSFSEKHIFGKTRWNCSILLIFGFSLEY